MVNIDKAGSFRNPYQAEKLINFEHQTLHKICTLTNSCALKYNGCLDTCISTSYALSHVLKKKGFDAKPYRIEAVVRPDDELNYLPGVALGSKEKCKSAGPGYWHGHLGVCVGKKWLLDPTLDQANKENWGDHLKVKPVTIPLFPEFWDRWGDAVHINFKTTTVRYRLHQSQVGFKTVFDSWEQQWMPLAEIILEELDSKESRLDD